MEAITHDMLVEVTNRCNHACIFCAHRKMNSKYLSGGGIDPLLLKRILGEAYEMGVRRVGLYTTGEMFLCKNIATHVRNAKELGFTYIYADTNGALATKENMRKVLLAGLDSIKFSINAGTRETYRYIHGKDDFEKVMKNLVDCYALREELGLSFKIMVSFVVTSKSEDEVEDFRQLIAPYIDELCIIGARITFAQDPEVLSELTPVKYEPYSPLSFCTPLFNRIHVTYDGFLTACCVDFNHDLLVADLKKVSLQEAWNCENMTRLRERHLNKDLEGTMCYNCLTGEYHPYEPLSLGES